MERLSKHLRKKAERYRRNRVDVHGAVGFKKSTQKELLRESNKNEEFLSEERARDSGEDIEAATGFSGIVVKPTHFLVGENGPEKMYINPITDYLEIEPTKKSGTQTIRKSNDFDFMSDYNKILKNWF